MENIFDNLFPIAGKKKENNKVVQLEMEVERLSLCLRMSQTANFKRKEAMEIMKNRLEQQDALIKRLNSILKNQDTALAQMQYTMKIQQERLEHIARIDTRMDSIHSEQTEILKFAQEYRQAQG